MAKTNQEEQKKAPILRFKGFTNDWEQGKIKDRLKVNSGKDYKHLSNGNIPVYGTSGYMLSVNKSLSNKNGIGIGRKGTIDKPQFLNAPFWTVDTLFYLTLKQKDNLSFFYFLTQKINWKKYDESTGVPSLSKATINSIKINVPNIDEQYKISHLLNALDNLITLYERKNNLYGKILKKAIDSLVDVPIYKIKSLDNVFDTVTDYVANGSFKDLRENVKQYQTEEYAYLIRLQDFNNNWKGPWLYTDKIGFSFLKKSKLIPGDIVLSNVGSVGNVFQVPVLDKPMTLAPNAILLKTSSNNTDFMYYLMLSSQFQKALNKKVTPGVQKKINKTDLKKIKIKLPELKDQNNIANLLNCINQYVKYNQLKLSYLKCIKKELLDTMFI